MSAGRSDGGGSQAAEGGTGSNMQPFQTSMYMHTRNIEGGSSANTVSTREVVQRSGMFGKSLIVERESCASINSTLRSNRSYKSNEATISNGFADDKNIAPPQQASWVHIAAIILSEVVGAGVLTLSQKYAQLGWVLSTLAILSFFALLVFISHLMLEVKKVFPAILNMSDAADYTIGRWAYWVAYVLLIILLLFILGDYLLLIGKSLGSAFYSVHLCQPWWVLIGAALVFPFTQLRTLSSTAALCFLSMVTIVGSVAIVIVKLIVNGREPTVETFVIAEDITFTSFMQSLSAIYFTFSGQNIFYEFMAEMKDYRDFMKVFIIAGPFQVGIYMIVGSVGYHYKGTEASGYFLDNLGFGPAYRVASAFLCFHMLVGYIIMSNVLSRILHIAASPYHVNDKGWRGKFEWLGCTSTVLILSFVIANAIPFFDLLTSLIGGLLVPPLCLLFPVVCYVRMRILTGVKLKWWEWIVHVALLSFGILMIVVSTMATVKLLISNWSTFGKPFSCHCEGVWDTCGCSADRMAFSEFNCSAIEP